MGIRRRVSWAGVGVGVGVAVAFAAAAGPAGAQVVSVTVKSAGELLGEFRSLARLAEPESARQIADGLDVIEATGVFNWLDRDKPVTATGDLVPPAAGQPPSLPAVTLYLPVKGRDEFLEGLKKLGLAVDDRPGVEGFTHKVAPPGGTAPPVYLLSDPPAGYAVLTNVPAGAAKLRAVKPEGLRPDRPGSVLVGLRIDRIPDQITSALLANVRQRNEVARARTPGESDAQYQGRLAGMALVEDAFTGLIRDGREVTLDADVDEKAGKFSLALGVDARPDTPAAKALGSFGTRRGRFADLWGDAAVTLQGVVPVPEAFRTLIHKSIEADRAEAARQKTPDDRRVFGLMLDALAPTLTGEAYDACVAVGSAASAGGKGTNNVVVFGVGLKDSKKVEAALREAIAKKLKGEERAKVVLDHDRGAGDTPIHRVTLDPKDLKPDEFGDPLMFLAFPEGAALAAVGGDGLGVMKQSLAALGKAPAGAAAGPQVGLDFSAVRLSRLHTGENEAAFREAAREVFAGADSARDRLRIGLSGEAARARLLLEADLPVLRFFARVGAAQKAK